jgi:hypothetical protein
MSRKRFPPTDPREWLNRARSNLVIAKSDTPGAFPEDLCFEAQQAAELAGYNLGMRITVAHDHLWPYHKLAAAVQGRCRQRRRSAWYDM